MVVGGSVVGGHQEGDSRHVNGNFLSGSGRVAGGFVDLMLRWFDLARPQELACGCMVDLALTASGLALIVCCGGNLVCTGGFFHFLVEFPS